VSQPQPYSPQHSFVADSATVPNFPGQSLDIEFHDVKATTDQVLANLALIQRDDGALKNGSVTYDSLSSSVQTNGLATAACWLTATSYLVGTTVYQNFNLYRCLVAHISGVFATDLAAAKWLLLVALPPGPQGPSGTLAVNSTTTLAAGQAATVVNVGTAQAASLNFGIPQGVQGVTGATGAGYGGTSTTSRLIANSVTKVFTTQAGLAYQVGTYVRASSAANGANFMEGLVSAYAGTSLSIAVTKIGGAGTFADWGFAVSGAPGAGDLLSTNNLSDLTNASTARTNLAVPGLATSNTFTKQQTATLQTLTDAATVNWDCSLGQKAKVTYGGNRTMAAVRTP
jgi:hypothetical protein